MSGESGVMDDVAQVTVTMRGGSVKTFPVFPDEKIQSVSLGSVLSIYYRVGGYSEVSLLGVESIFIERRKKKEEEK